MDIKRCKHKSRLGYNGNVTKKTRQFAFIGLMLPGILLGVLFAGLVVASCGSALVKNPGEWSVVGNILLNAVAAVLFVVAPLSVYGLAERSRTRRSRRLLTSAAVVLAYLLPSIYLGLMGWSLQLALAG